MEKNNNSSKQVKGQSFVAPFNSISFTIQQKQAPAKNTTGLPDNLKSGIEHLSGIDISDVKVHYNSSQPAQLNAHAYAQGNQIHIAPGQEKYLPHEAWHVVQQKQGKVKPTKQLKGKVNINDDVGLEKEADLMGAKALQLSPKHQAESLGYLAQKKSQILQRAFDPPTNPLENAIAVLANSTVAGRAAMQAGNGKLTVVEAVEWKTITRDGRIGIGIPANVIAILTQWGANHAAPLANREQYEVLIAHELTHLRHFMSAPGTYAIRGQRENFSGWDADPEEELTVKGETRIRIADWNRMYEIAFHESGMAKLLAAKAAYERDLVAPASTAVARSFKKNLAEVEAQIANIRLDKIPVGAVEEGEFYVFRDVHNENAARAEKGFRQRDHYVDGSFVRQVHAPVDHSQQASVSLRSAFRFSDMRQKLDRIEAGLNDVRLGLADIDERLNRLEQNLIKLRQDLAAIKQRLDKIKF